MTNGLILSPLMHFSHLRVYKLRSYRTLKNDHEKISIMMKDDHEKISIRMEDSQRALVSGITDIKRIQIAQDSKISSVSNEVSRQAEMRSTVMRNGVNIDKVLSEVSALGGIIDTYEKELEEYKKQVFELMKQNDRLSLENQKLSEEIMLLKNQSRGRDIGLDDQDLDYGER